MYLQWEAQTDLTALKMDQNKSHYGLNEDQEWIAERPDDRVLEILSADLGVFSELMKIAANELSYRNLADLQKAKLVRMVLKATGHKSYKSIYHLVNRGYIKNLPVDPKAFRVADALLGRPTQVVRSQLRKRKLQKY